jgi:plastocyanin
VLTIEAVDSEGFSLDRLRAAPGETITVVFKNKDAGSGEPHNWHISLPSGEFLTELEEGPDTQEITFTVPGPGEYLYVCDTHLPQMTGLLIVE